MFEETRAVARDVLGEEHGRHAAAVGAQGGGLDPLDHVLAGGQEVRVDLHAHVLPREAQGVERACVVLGGKNVHGLDESVERAAEGRRRGHVGRDGSERMRVPRVGDLHGELAAIAQTASETAEQIAVVGHPVQGRVREHEIPTGLAEIADLTGCESEPRGLVLGAFREHGGRAVEAQGLPGTEPLVQLGRQRTRAAAQIDHPHVILGQDELDEIVEWLGPLAGEAFVLLRIPGIDRHVMTASHTPARSHNRWAACALLVLSCATEGGTPEGEGVRAEVQRIVDGDTIRVMIDGASERVRYIGVDTPEVGRGKRASEPLAEAATQANRRLVGDGPVRLVYDVAPRDRYGRLLAYVYSKGGTFVNAALVEEGYAQVMTVPPNVRHRDLFRRLEAAARESDRGLWGQR